MLESGGTSRRVFRVLRRGFHFSPVRGKDMSMHRSELYQKVCSNRAPGLAERWYEGKSVRVGTHSLADFTI